MAKTIFISHSSKDEKLVATFVDTILGLGIGFIDDDIFCTSVEGLGIKTGDDWRNAIKENLIGSKAIILFITPNYKESEICLNEMGAAWAIDAMVIPIIVPPINYQTIGVIFDVKQALLLTKETDLDKLKDLLQDFISTPKKTTPRWTTKKQEAIAIFNRKLKESPFLTPVSRDILTKLEEEHQEIKQAFDEVVIEKQNLFEYCKQLEEAKDKNDVIAIKQDIGLLDDYAEFFSKAKEIGKEINQFKPVVRTIIFNEFAKNNLSLTWSDRKSYEDELNQAIAKNIITEDERLNKKHPSVAKALNALGEFENFFNTRLSEDSFEKLQIEYPDLLLEINNSDFWGEIFGVEHLLF